MTGKTRPDVNGRMGEARRLSTPTEKEKEITTRCPRTTRKNSTFIETNGEVTRHQRMTGKTRPDVNGRTGEARRLSTPTEKEKLGARKLPD